MSTLIHTTHMWLGTELRPSVLVRLPQSFGMSTLGHTTHMWLGMELRPSVLVRLPTMIRSTPLSLAY